MRRCLLPADGYFEWYPTSQLTRAGKPLKQPFFIRPPGRRDPGDGGLYEIWRNQAVADKDADGAFLWTATVITTTAEDSLGHIHDRMPMLVEPNRYDEWLDAEATDNEDLQIAAGAGRAGAAGGVPGLDGGQPRGEQRTRLVEPLALEGRATPDVLFDS